MSDINFNCDVCGREVLGCTFVNGMKFCAKCYQETFGNKITTDMLLDMIKNAGWDVDGVGVLKNIDAEATIMKQEKQITDLEAKLAEKEEEIKNLVLAHFESDANKPVLTTTQIINQDKISFCIEKLVNVQKYISDNAVYLEEESFGREINDYIDNQINELKGEK